jgi:hypothetical protein
MQIRSPNLQLLPLFSLLLYVWEKKGGARYTRRTVNCMKGALKHTQCDIHLHDVQNVYNVLYCVPKTNLGLQFCCLPVLTESMLQNFLDHIFLCMHLVKQMIRNVYNLSFIYWYFIIIQ